MDQASKDTTQKSSLNSNKVLLIGGITAVVLIVFVFAAVNLKGQKSQENQTSNLPSEGDATVTETLPQVTPTPVLLRASLSLEPANANFNLNETKEFVLKANFTNGGPNKKLDYFKTEISFDNKYLAIPSGRYIDVSKSGFSKTIKVDGPVVANQSGKITIELGATEANGGPATDKTLTIAKIYFKSLAKTDSVQKVTFGNTQIVNNLSKKIGVDIAGLTYKVTSAATTSGANQ